MSETSSTPPPQDNQPLRPLPTLLEGAAPALLFEDLQNHLTEYNTTLAQMSLREILQWASGLPHVAQVSAFGASGMVMIHELYHEPTASPTMPIVFVDTLHHFPETLAFVQRARERYDLQVHEYHCQFAHSQEAFEEAVHSTELWKTQDHLYDLYVKVEPLQRALDELGTRLWITGRRRDQGGARDNMRVLEVDDDGRLKLNPLAYWNVEQVWAYITTHQVIVNPLYYAGYRSIGDKMTTRPVSAEEDERSGRFFQIPEKTECGIHNRPKNWRTQMRKPVCHV